MNRNFILILLLLIASAVAFFVWKNKKDPSASFERTESNFKIADVNTIGRIVITTKDGSRSDLRRRADHWTINDEHRARQTNIDNLLKTINRQHLDHIPTREATANILKSMAVNGIHVEIFDHREQKILGYYVGGVTQNERATHFLKEGATQPYSLVLPGFEGGLRARYALRPVDWRDIRFWIEENEKIDTLKVHYPKQRQHSFVIYKSGNDYEVEPMFTTTPRKENVNEVKILSYMTSLTKLACENFLNESPQRDSIIQSVPFLEMDMIYPDKHHYLNFFAISQVIKPENSTEIPRYFLDYSGRDFMIAQHNVIKEAFRSYDYFFD